MQNSLFEACDPLLLRVSARSSEQFEQLTPEVPKRLQDADAEDFEKYVRQVTEDVALREALAVSSGSLATAVRNIRAGVPVGRKKALSTAVSVSRYVLRATGRPTPFGLLAGFARARWQGNAFVALGDKDDRVARIDAAWLYESVMEWLELPAVRQSVKVVINNLCHVQNERLVLPYVRINLARVAPQGQGREISINRTAFVRMVEEFACRPIPYAELLEMSAARFPEAPLEVIDGALSKLLQTEILISNITPQRMSPQFIDSVVDALGRESEAGQLMASVGDRLSEFCSNAPGEGVSAWGAAIDLLSAHRAERKRPPIQVDLRADADVRLPRTLARDVEGYAAAMWRMSWKVPNYAHMREYRDRFIDRYGLGTAVRLEDVVDPMKGIGFPAGYLNPPVADVPRGTVTFDEHTDRDDERREYLATLLQKALMSKSRELVLTEEDITALSTDDLDAPAPAAMELYFQIHARSVEALDRGEFSLVPTPNIGSMTAGSTAARFAHLVGCSDDLGEVMGSGSGENTVVAEVSFLPRNPRNVNLSPTSRLLRHEIPVGTFADGDAEGNIDWRDIAIAADHRGLRAVWTVTGQEVVPVAPHMMTVDTGAPNIARLLIEIGRGQDKMWHPWLWSGLDAMTHFPRVRYGRVVVSPMTWRPTALLRERAAEPGTAWDDTLHRWRDEFRAPAHLVVIAGDKSYALDLSDAFHRELLRREITRGAVMLTEAPEDAKEAFGWLDGRSTEVIVPLRRAASATPAKPDRRTPLIRHPEGDQDVTHLPGEEWLYAKLYTSADRYRDLLTRCLPALAQEVAGHVDRWFFIRYRDPSTHLRLRFHGDPAGLATHVLPALSRHARMWLDAGVIQSMALDTYEPEYGRYGGPATMPAAESLFCLDSESALTQLAERPAKFPEIPDEILTAAGYALVLESLGDWDWCSWVRAAFGHLSTDDMYRRQRTRIRRLIRPGRVSGSVAEELGGAVFPKLWHESATATNLGDLILPGGTAELSDFARDTTLLGLLHMHHNRVVGTDRDKETRSYSILAALARDHTFQKRAD